VPCDDVQGHRVGVVGERVFDQSEAAGDGERRVLADAAAAADKHDEYGVADQRRDDGALDAEFRGGAGGELDFLDRHVVFNVDTNECRRLNLHIVFYAKKYASVLLVFSSTVCAAAHKHQQTSAPVSFS
jgi:hypothetical protein